MIERLVLPDCLRVVKSGWFCGAGIRELVVPQGVERIEDRAFAGCRSLERVVFAGHSHLTEIGEEAFVDTKLRGFVAPEGLRMLGRGAFRGCGYMRYAALNEGLRGEGAVSR